MKHWNYIKHAPKILFKNRVSPIYLVFFITNICNAKCRHCLLGNTVPKSRPKEELSIDEIEKIAKSMDDLMFLLPTGGQPFLRKDIAEIVKIFYRETNVRNVGIPTNGTMTEQTVEFVKEVMSSCPEIDLGIDVSIDGIREIHDNIRGVKGLFDKAVLTYKELRKLEKIYPNFNVNIETTVSSYNDDHLLEMYDYFTKELGANTIFTLLTRGAPREPASKFFNISKYERYAEKMEAGIKNRILTGYYNFPFCDVINAKRIVRHRLIAKTVRENRYQVPCMGGRLGAAIFANGEVLPCELHTDMVLGNLRDYNYDFKKIWFSEKADNARKTIRDTKCFCTYECFLTLNILFNKRMYFQILKEWLLIKKSKIFANFMKDRKMVNVQ
jgi:MoaA/NifB/PqqE/SkfB family radical SAM enzyme